MNTTTIYNGQPETAQQWEIVLRHDKGKAKFLIRAATEESATKQVLKLELAPKSAIISITTTN